MKKINKPALGISLLILILACSVLSMTSVGENQRFTWDGMNPWNGIEGIAFTVSYFLRTGQAVTILLTIGLMLIIWWRLYSLFSQWLRKE